MAALNEPDAIRLYSTPTRYPRIRFPLGYTTRFHFQGSGLMGGSPWRWRPIPPGVLWVPAHVVPINHPGRVVTIHDLGYLHVPEGHTDRQRRMLD